MNIVKSVNGSVLCLKIEGRLDTVTAPKLSEELRNSLDGVDELVYDFEDLKYVSSAGLRVLLMSQKQMEGKSSGKGSVTIKNVNKNIMDILSITGFKEIFNIE